MEICEVLHDLPYDLLFLGDLAIDDSGFLEDGATFRDNAFKKASFFAEQTGFLTLAEDSGIIVDALRGELGVKTRRWGAGESATDEEWINYFMNRMEAEENRSAKFVCAACLYTQKSEEYFEGETKGEITSSLEYPILAGLPLSSCFRPEGYNNVYAALGTEEKNKISHRGKALIKARNHLLSL